MVEDGVLESILPTAVGKTLKSELKYWIKKEYCIPKATTEYVERMEDVLEVYKQPYDPIRPAVCLDELSW